MDQQPKPVKPFLEYDRLVMKLAERGMLLRDPLRAQRKLTQVGYYRLSGYWSPALKYIRNEDGGYDKSNDFQANTSFDSIFSFYLFDKKLRQEISCAIERIEIYLRTIIAHELGRTDPLAHENKKNFSKFATTPEEENYESDFDLWHKKHTSLLHESREESIRSHIDSGKPIPIWVASEAWTFGTISKLYSMLNGANQKLICDRLGIDDRVVLDNWLINLNGTRNRCAHHSRVCNRPNHRTLKAPKLGYFNLLQLGQFELNKLYGLISVIWFLVQKIGPSSNWILRIADLIDNKPNANGLTLRSMGFKTDAFPRHLFKLPVLRSDISASNPDPLEDAITKTVDVIGTLENSQKLLNDVRITDEHIEKIMNLALKLEDLKKMQSKAD
ncbi:abortive infection bacteriophage resistance protein [Pseudomonas baetica]|uniref:Abortive infection bacteriophage resistance protein n=2 Tax=Pseudomonas baetica TaxID=674054 RepID=A0ABX4Q3U7_9PSED|nr:abortive infection bacteriophage resistance protein [Pseudomonas baetica]PTC19951.1 abortive phage infection protein [Pseudomonas baetica]